MKVNEIDNYIIWGEMGAGEKLVTMDSINKAIDTIRRALDEAIEIREIVKNQ